MKKIHLRLALVLVSITAVFLSGCSVPTPKRAQVTQKREITESLPDAILDQLSIEDLRVTADLMARDLVLQPFLRSHGRYPVVAIKPIENKTDLTIDPDIFQKTMRVKLMENSGPNRILFRDEESHTHTIDERLKQSGKVRMSSTTTRTKRSQATQVGAPLPATIESEVETTLTEYGEASKKVADIDYFLTGLIYSSTEVAQFGAEEGMRYFQFQFRLTDAQTNIIMWEKEYTVKRQARFN